MDNSLTRWKRPIFKIPFSRNSKSSVWKPKFFHRQAFPSFFLLYNVITHTDDTPYRVWFDLDNSLTRWKKPIFKIPFSRNSEISVWKPNFFPEQAKPKILFALRSHYTGDTPYRVWFDLDNSLTRWKKTIFKIPFLGNSKSSVWKPNLFPKKAKPKIFFALHCHYTRDTPYRVWFDLDNSLTRWKRPIFKIPFSRNSKSSVWKTKFFPRQAKPKILFALHSHYTGDTAHRVWFDLDNSLTRWKKLFLKISKFRNSRNYKIPYENPTFFLSKPNQKYFCCTLSLHWWYSITSLVWVGPLLDPMKKNYF